MHVLYNPSVCVCFFFLSFSNQGDARTHTHTHAHTYAHTQQMKKTLKVFLLWGFVVCSVFECVRVCACVAGCFWLVCCGF